LPPTGNEKSSIVTLIASKKINAVLKVAYFQNAYYTTLQNID
jgi:hypothetical protein